MPKGFKAGGRKKGSSNVVSKTTKDNLLDTFILLGGVPQMVKWAQANNTEFYKLWAKTLPLTVAGDPSNPVAFKITVEHVKANQSQGT